MRKVKTISISLPPDVLALIDQHALKNGLSRSSYVTMVFASMVFAENEQIKEARKNGKV